jgi:tetratricopeptide (TPR) repeat protein
MACVEPKDIPISLLPADRSRVQEMEALGVLDAYSFAIRRPIKCSVDLHRLVHLATRRWLKKKGEFHEWTSKAVAHFCKIFPDYRDYKNRATWRDYLPHVLYVLSADGIEKEADDWCHLAWKVAMCLSKDGRYKEADGLYVQLIEIGTRVRGEEHRRTLACMHSMAMMWNKQGRSKEAEELYGRVIQVHVKVLGKKHPTTLTSSNNLASVFWAQGRSEEAEELHIQVLNAKKKMLGDEHRSTLISMTNVASTYTSQGRCKDSEELLLQVMGIRERVLGEAHPDTLNSMSNLASALYGQGKTAEALTLLEKCVQLRSRTLGADHPKTLQSSKLWNTWKAEEANCENQLLHNEAITSTSMTS